MFRRIIYLIISVVMLNTSVAQNVTVELESSLNGCGLSTDCAAQFVCFDILMTSDSTINLDAYDILVTYDNTVLSRVNGGDDASCVLTEGLDADLEATSATAYRVGAISPPTGNVTLVNGVPSIIHTICFQILDINAYPGTILSVGGEKFGGAIKTTVAFAGSGSDDTVPEEFFTVDSTNSPCLATLLIAINDSATTTEDLPVVIDVLANDVDGDIDPASVAEVDAPSNGSTSVNTTTGEITYIPNPDFNGVDSFTYVVCDSLTSMTCDTASVFVTIDPANDAPMAVNDADTTDEDTPVVIDVILNDTDSDGNIDPATVAEVDAPSNGSTMINTQTGEITYTPDPAFNGMDTFTYVVCDDGTPLPAMCDTAEVIVTINPINDPIVAVDDVASTTENTAVVINVPNNDTDIDGNIDPASVAEVDAPSNGSTSVNTTTGEITYTPDPGFNGMDTFTYVVCDDGTPLPALCDTAEVIVTVGPINDAPMAVNDADTTDEDTPVVIDVIVNDTDSDGNIDPATVAEVDAPSNGSTMVNTQTGEITYTPDPEFNGMDTFTYVVCDDGTPLPAMCDTAEVIVTINPINDPIVAVDDVASTTENTAVVINVPNNDTDIDGNIDPASVAEVDAPSNGSTSVNTTTGEITYTPDPGFNGLDTFTYVVCDDGTPLPALCDTAEVIVTVGPINDAPMAVNDVDTTDEDTPVVIDVIVNDTDSDGNIDPATVAEVDAPSNGSTMVNTQTGEITYTPDPEFNGMDTFTYVVCDDGTPLPAMCDTAEVIVTINPINDPIVAVDDVASTTENTAVVIDVPNNDTDIDGNIDPASVAEVDAPSNGSTSVNTTTGEITYTPDPGFNGMDTFTYVICDDGTPLPALCDTAEVIVTVGPINDAPMAINDLDTTNEDTPVIIDVVGNDTDPDGFIDPASVAEVDAPSNGSTSVNTTTGEITYTPDPDFNGMDTFTYVVCDDGIPLPVLCDTAQVIVTIIPVNDTPVIVQLPVITPEDSAVTFCPTISDVDLGDVLTLSLCTPPANGAVAITPNGLCVTYTPDPGYNGPDTACVIVCDDGNPILCDTLLVPITVIPENDAPMAVNDADTTDEDTPVVIDVIVNDTDSDGNIDPATVAEVDAPSNGSTMINTQTGEITYTPDPEFNGMDTFTYVVCDDGTPLPAMCDTAEVIVTINPINDPIVAVDDAASTTENTAVVIDVPNNDTDIDGNIDPASVAEVDAPSNGSTSVNTTTGEITYTPDPGFSGVDTFTYVICDDGTPLPALCDTAEVIITVGGVNDAPVAINDLDTTNEDTPVIIDVVGNDTDPDGLIDPASVAEVDAPSNGSTSVNTTTGEITYTPDPEFSGMDTFTYVVCDNGIPAPVLCDTATVIVTINPINDPIVAVDDVASTTENTAVVIDVPNNDTDIDGNIDPASVAEVDAPSNGSTSVNTTTGEITYTPDPGFSGVDTFTYVICDDGTPLPAMCDTAEVIVTVGGVNDAPVAVNDMDTTNEDTPVVIDVTGNDTDPDGLLDPASVAEVDAPSNGSTSVNVTTGEITYIPDPNFNGMDTFTYVVCDNGIPTPVLCDTATVIVTINPVNDTPVIVQLPVVTPEDSAVTFCPTISDIDLGDSLTLSLCMPPTNGAVAITPDGLCVTYTPNPGFNGPDTACVIVCDDGNPILCDTVLVPITVVPENDAPMAVNDADTTDEDTPVVIDVTVNDTDSDGNIDPASVAEIDAPSNGSTSVDTTTGEITYTPDPNFNGVDTFTYVVCDDGTPLPPLCDTAMVIVTINPINDPIVAVDDAASTLENTAVVIDVPNNDTDIDGNIDPATVAEVDAPSNGSTSVDTTTGEITYTPDIGFSGIDTFTYVICDDGTPLPALCDTAQVVVFVGQVNNPPVAIDDAAVTDEDSPVVIDVTGNDFDIDGTVDPTTVAEVDAPSNGTTSIDPNTGEITYTPNPNYNGMDTFTYIICDLGIPAPVLCDTATVIIDVLPVNDPIVAIDDNETTVQNVPVLIDVVNNDTDIDDNIDPTSVAVVDAPMNGTVVVDPVTGEITYTPDNNYVGNDVFTYVICDTGNPILCDTAEVLITVLPLGVEALNDTTTIDNLDLIVIDILSNDTSPDSPSVVITIDPTNGTASVNDDGSINYVPFDLESELDSFTYVLCIGSICDTAVVYIITEEQAIVINVPNALSPDGDGTNDLFVISDLFPFPNAELKIYNRWGDEVWNSAGPYLHDWSGVNFSSVNLPDGTYYYTIDLKVEGEKDLVGFIQLHR